MTKPNYRYQRSANDKETRMLRLWQTAISPVDAFYAQMAEGIFRGIKWAIAEKVSRQAGNDGRLSSCDERIYDYYKKLMHYYNNVLDYYNNAESPLSLTNGHCFGEILAGMKAVIVSRVKVFNEIGSSKESREREGEGTILPGNPVKTEKNMLISKSVRNFSEHYDVISYRCRSELYTECFHNTRKIFIDYLNIENLSVGGQNREEQNDGVLITRMADGIFQSALRIVKEKGFLCFYELYTESIRAATNSLNDFYARNAVAYYSEQLINEHEILRNLATVQIQALEHEMTLLPSEVEAEVQEAAKPIINAVLAAHQALSRDVSEIQEYLKMAASLPTVDETEEYQTFAGSLEEAAERGFRASMLEDAAVVGFKTRMESMREAFTRELSATINSWLVSGADEKEIQGEAQTIIDSVVEMTRQIREVFAEICDYYNNDSRLQAEGVIDSGISRGIAETMDIKVQSLDESIEAFCLEVTPIASAITLSADSVDNGADSFLTFELAKKAFLEMINEMVGYQKEDRRTLSAIKKYMSFKPDIKIYAEYRERRLRPLVKSIELLNAKVLKFKREYVLYEISTFEEIQHYSVSRLREFDEVFLQDFVCILDLSAEKLDKILAKNGIEPIRPMARTMFNGREHEVLMAEKNDDYKKGEIIKMMNSGYRQGNVILLRANVIASK